MEREITKIYQEANKDISKKWDAYMKSHKAKVDKAHADLLEAIKSGDKDDIAKAREEYERAVANVTVNNKRFQDMRDEICAKMTHVNEVAVDYVNGNMPKIYTVNYNQFGDTPIKGYSFALVNENAVKNLINTGDLSLYKHVDPVKDMAWNEKYINSQVLQGILQGESIPKISARIFPEIMDKGGLIERNKATAVRIARTMTTAAENKGRQDSFKKAEDDGVIMEREWIAAHDDHTRAWHLELHGVRVGVDEPWENEYGEIMYPGDPNADPANVYNCRCSIRAHVKGFKRNEDIEDVKEEPKTIEENNEPENVTNKFGQEITFDFKSDVHDKQVKVIKELSNEYDTRLVTVSSGAKKAAGEVDIMGQYMRINGTKEATAIHEFGHTLASTRADKYGLTNDKEFWSEIRKVRDDFTLTISSYADADRSLDEFMCEAFTQAKCVEMGIDLPYEYGNDLTYSNQVLAIIDEYFKRKHKK